MKIVNTDNAEHYRWGNDSDGWHLLNSDELSIIQEHMPPGAEEKRHYHNVSQQFFYILSGVACIEVSGEVYQVPARSGIHIPPGSPHQVTNKDAGHLTFLVVSQPKSHGDRTDI